MKHFKILMAVAILAVITVFIYSCAKDGEKLNKNVSNDVNPILETRGGNNDLLEALGTDCFNGELEIPGCNNVAIPGELIITDLPSYPGCTFKVIFNYYQCNLISGINQVSVSDYQIVEHDCPAFSSDLVDPANIVLWGSFFT